MKVRFTLLLLAIAFPLSSVGAYKTYPGPKLPKDQIAIIKPEIDVGSLVKSPVLIQIIAVDGNRVPKQQNVALKPGKHTLEVGVGTCGTGLLWTSCKPTNFATFTFEAQAGHTYMVRQAGGALWTEDTKTQAIVAGSRPMTLNMAVDQGDLNQVKQLIFRGAKVKAKDKDGNTPLHQAAIKGHTKVAALLIHEGGKVKAKNNAGDTPLHVAAYYGQTAMVELLIAEGAKVNTRNNDGHRPLRLAADKDHKDIIELLKRHGAKE